MALGCVTIWNEVFLWRRRIYHSLHPSSRYPCEHPCSHLVPRLSCGQHPTLAHKTQNIVRHRTQRAEFAPSMKVLFGRTCFISTTSLIHISRGDRHLRSGTLIYVAQHRRVSLHDHRAHAQRRPPRFRCSPPTHRSSTPTLTLPPRSAHQTLLLAAAAPSPPPPPASSHPVKEHVEIH